MFSSLFLGLESAVVKVLDHRPVEKISNWCADVARIEPVGSCCTLVADEILKINESLFSRKEVALLVYGIALNWFFNYVEIL